MRLFKLFQGLCSGYLCKVVLLYHENLNLTTEYPDIPYPKRRKTGLNSRFDRMVEAMNATCDSPSGSTFSRRNARNRSSSSSSYGPPTTPLAPCYEELKSDALGRNFSVLKVKCSVSEEREADDVGDSEVTVCLRLSFNVPFLKFDKNIGARFRYLPGYLIRSLLSRKATLCACCCRNLLFTTKFQLVRIRAGLHEKRRKAITTINRPTPLHRLQCFAKGISLLLRSQ